MPKTQRTRKASTLGQVDDSAVEGEVQVDETPPIPHNPPPSPDLPALVKNISTFLEFIPSRPVIMAKYASIPIEVQACRFVKLVDLVIDRARASSFTIHAVRMETHSLITNLRSIYIDVSHRFPEEPHVMTVGTVADLVTKLLATLDFGEHTPQDNVNNRSVYNDKNLTYHKACEAILNHLTNLRNASAIHGIYDMCNFEATYSLTWA